MFPECSLNLPLLLQVKPEEMSDRVERMFEDTKQAQKQIESLKAELAMAKSALLVNDAISLPCGAKLVVAQLDGVDAKALGA
jgi:alanyl-tRNA synthetase